MATTESTDGNVVGVVWRSSVDGGEAVFDADESATSGVDVAATEPVSPDTGDVWIDSDEPFFRGCQVRRTANQTIANNSSTVVAFPTGSAVEDWDTDTFHDLTANDSRITFLEAGRFDVNAWAAFVGHVTGYRMLRVRLNGTTDLRRLTIGANIAAQGSMTLSFKRDFAANDYIEILVLQTSGGNLDLDVTNLGEAAVGISVQKILT